MTCVLVKTIWGVVVVHLWYNTLLAILGNRGWAKLLPQISQNRASGGTNPYHQWLPQSLKHPLARSTGSSLDWPQPGASVQSMRQIVDPHVFYWGVHPWFNGSGSGSSAPPWIYEGVSDMSKLDLSRPSAGQSSVTHTLGWSVSWHRPQTPIAATPCAIGHGQTSRPRLYRTHEVKYTGEA